MSKKILLAFLWIVECVDFCFLLRTSVCPKFSIMSQKKEAYYFQNGVGWVGLGNNSKDNYRVKLILGKKKTPLNEDWLVYYLLCVAHPQQLCP